MEERSIDLVLYCTVNGDSLNVNLDIAHRIYQESVYFLLPPRRPFIRKNYIVNMYETGLLCSLAASITTSCFLWKLFTKKSVADSAFDTLQMSVQLFLNKSPSSSKTRIFFISLIVFLSCLNIAFQTRLSSVLTSPSYTPQIKSIRQLLFNSDINIIKAFNNTLRTMYAVKDVQQSLRKKWIIFPQNLRTVNLIEDFVANKSEAIAVSRVHLLHFKNPNKLHIIYYDPVGDFIFLAGARKGFPLLDALNYWINLLKERGLMLKYRQDSASIIKKFDFDDLVSQHSFIKIDLEHVEGPFVIWVAGIIISSIVCCIEVASLYARTKYQALNRIFHR